MMQMPFKILLNMLYTKSDRLVTTASNKSTGYLCIHWHLETLTRAGHAG